MGVMESARPLWQFVLTLFAVLFATARITTALAISTAAPEGDLILPGAHGAQSLLALATAAGLWAGRPWVRIPLVILGLTVMGTAIVEASMGLRPFVFAISQILVAAFATAALTFVLTREFGTFDAPRTPPTRS